MLTAFIHWVTGLVFALLLSLVIVLGLGTFVGLGGFFHEIEERGIDATMRLRALLAGTMAVGAEARAPAEGQRAQPNGYVFIDLDSTTCLEAEGEDKRCVSRSPASGGAAARVANAILETKPRVVILDVRLWSIDPKAKPSADLDALLHGARHLDVPVIAAAPAAPSDEVGRVFVDWSLAPGFRDTRIKFAPALAWPDGRDAVVRRYPTAVHAEIAGGRQAPDTVRVVRAASLPYLAALYVNLPKAQADCIADRTTDRLKTCDIPESAEPAGAGYARAKARAQPSADDGRLLFTIPGDAADTTAPSNHTALPSSEVVLRDGTLRVDPARFTDKVVVIGYSGAAGLDRHTTPLGEMSGAELVLNATRSFASGSQVTRDKLGPTIQREVVATLISSIPFLAFWLLQGLVWKYIHGPGPTPVDWAKARWIRRIDLANVRPGWTSVLAARPRNPKGRASAGHLKAIRDWMLAPVRAATDHWPNLKTWPRRTVAAAIVVILFTAAVVISGALTTWLVTVTGIPFISKGIAVDVLLPVAILALETFADAAKYIQDLIHRRIMRFLQLLVQTGSMMLLLVWDLVLLPFPKNPAKTSEQAP